MPPLPITLRPSVVADLDTLFIFQLDAEARHMAAFTPADPTDQAAYLQKFGRLLQDPTVNQHTILVDGAIVGSIAKFEIDGEPELTYWLDRPWWGRGVASAALRQFLALEPARPLLGRAAADNMGSQRVLEKAGFVRIGTDRGFANARQAEVEEVIYRLG